MTSFSYYRIFLLCVFSFVLASCSGDTDNQDSASEASCSTATGEWELSAVTCSETAATSFTALSINFSSATSLTQAQGSTDCVSATSWDLAINDFDASFEMTGNGDMSCTVNDSSVTSCSGSTNSCNSSTSITGYQNNFSTCVISGGQMQITRTVSSENNPNDQSYCSDSEQEVLTFLPATASDDDPPTSNTLDIGGTDPADLGTVSISTSNSINLTMTNNASSTASGIAASGLAAPFSFLGGSYPGTGGTCTSTLSAGASCVLVVSFLPTTAGTATDSLIIDYNDGSSSQNFTHGLTGVGTSASVANLTISESDPYDYGSIPTSSSASHTFTVTNTGSGTATSISEIGLSFPFTFTGGSYPGVGGTCGVTLSAAATCTLQISFAPSSSGAFSDTIQLLYNNGSSAVQTTRDIQGTGSAASVALLIISESDPFDFGSIQNGQTFTHLFTVTNTGGGTAISIFESGLAAPFGFVGGAYPGTGGTCSSVVASGSSCVINVEFAPSAIGVFSDSISLDYNDGSTVQAATRDVQGTSTP